MPVLDPQMAAILARVKAAGLPSYATMTADAARTEQERRNAYWNENPKPVAKIEDQRLAGPFGDRLLRIYDNSPDAGMRPGIVYFHGGGWVIGSPRSHDIVGRSLAIITGLPVLAYDYVKAPDHAFPQPVEDCIAAFHAIQHKAASLQVDPDWLGVAGDSAGASLSLNVAIACRDGNMTGPRAMALIYPSAGLDLDSESHKNFGTEDYLLSSELMDWFWRHYVQDVQHHDDPRLRLAEADLSDLCPAYLSVAEFDPLLDDGNALLDRMRHCGTEIEYALWRGVTHASLVMGRDLDQANRFLQEIGDFFKRRLRQNWAIEVS